MIKSLACLLLFTGFSHAASIANFSLETNDRFTAHADFIGNGFDWSGVGRVTSSTGTNRWATLIGDNYFLTAAHFSPTPGSAISFVSNDLSQTFSYTVGGLIPVFGDLRLGYFTSNADSSLTRYSYGTTPADSIAETGLAGQTLFSVANGSSSAGTVFNQAVSTNQVESFIEGGTATFTAPGPESITLADENQNPVPVGFDNLILFQNEAGDTSNTFETHEFFLQSGDSGSPLFSTTVNNELILQGIAYAIFNDVPGNFVDPDTTPDSDPNSDLETRNASLYSYTGSYANEISNAISMVPTVPEASTAILSLLGLTSLLTYRNRA